MIVIAITGILAAALFPSMTQYLKRSRDAARIADIQSIQTALSAHHIDQERYPLNTSSGCMNNTVLGANYFSAGVPTSPGGPLYNEGCGNNGHYGYGLGSGTGVFYILTARMENQYGGNYSGSMLGMTGIAMEVGFFNAKNNTIKGSGDWFLATSDGISYNSTGTAVPASLVPVNGGWSSWSSCSGTCGTTGNQYRSCDNPTPQNGGTNCTGPTLQSCGMPACVTYTITFDANGGSVSPPTRSITQPNPVGTLPTPTRTNYVFDGWYDTGATLGGNLITASTVPTANTTHYARWIGPFLCASGNPTTKAALVSCDTAPDIVAGGYSWKACNLGATYVCQPGNYYQWGRDVSFPSTGTVPTIAGPLSLTAANATMSFITNGSTSPYDWLNPQDNNRWGGSGTTQTVGTYQTATSANQALMQGPCPTGYHVPTYKEAYDTITSALGNNITTFTNTLKPPLSGFRNSSYGSLFGQGSGGYWWLSSPNSVDGRLVDWNSSAVGPTIATYRTYGVAVRCVRN